MATRNQRRNVKPRPRPVATETVEETPATPQGEAVEVTTTENPEVIETETGAVIEQDAEPIDPQGGEIPSPPNPEGEDDDFADADGDGIADQFDLDETEFRQYWQDYLDKSRVVPPKGHILFPGEPLTFQGNIIRGDMVELREDVYRMVVPFRSTRPTFTLEARKGTVVPKVQVVTKTQYRSAVGGLFDMILEG